MILRHPFLQNRGAASLFAGMRRIAAQKRNTHVPRLILRACCAAAIPIPGARAPRWDAPAAPHARRCLKIPAKRPTPKTKLPLHFQKEEQGGADSGKPRCVIGIRALCIFINRNWGAYKYAPQSLRKLSPCSRPRWLPGTSPRLPRSAPCPHRRGTWATGDGRPRSGARRRRPAPWWRRSRPGS